jgi:DNA-binding NarL/FixJ family response regulator
VAPGWDAAHARLAWGRALAGAGDRLRAAEVVRRGLEIADALGAVPLADELRSLARSARLQVEPAQPAETPSGLTEREADVLALVGRGLTNAQIGERLYMSPKTASVHVSRLIAKLGVANRTEAAAQAQRLGLVGD